ncbi:MAG: hypothetical protein AAGE59_27960 [Cyanobacteria bacterium P01_F01_bin.86]
MAPAKLGLGADIGLFFGILVDRVARKLLLILSDTASACGLKFGEVPVHQDSSFIYHRRNKVLKNSW